MKTDTHRLKEVVLNFIVPIVCLGVAGILFFVVIYPSFKKMPDLADQLRVATTTRDILKGKLDKLHRFVDFKSVLEENSNLVNTVLPDEEYVPGLLDQVNEISDESGMQLSKLSYSVSDILDTENAASYSSVAISLGSEGSYGQMIAFMEALEKASRLVNIATFRFSSSDRKVDNYALTFILNAPYLSVSSSANTDEPLTLDITNNDFVNFVNKIKGLRYFEKSGDLSDITVEVEEADTIDEDLTEETTPSEPAQPVVGGGL